MTHIKDMFHFENKKIIPTFSFDCADIHTNLKNNATNNYSGSRLGSFFVNDAFEDINNYKSSHLRFSFNLDLIKKSISHVNNKMSTSNINHFNQSNHKQAKYYNNINNNYKGNNKTQDLPVNKLNSFSFQKNNKKFFKLNQAINEMTEINFDDVNNNNDVFRKDSHESFYLNERDSINNNNSNNNNENKKNVTCSFQRRTTRGSSIFEKLKMKSSSKKVTQISPFCLNSTKNIEGNNNNSNNNSNNIINTSHNNNTSNYRNSITNNSYNRNSNSIIFDIINDDNNDNIISDNNSIKNESIKIDNDEKDINNNDNNEDDEFKL